MKTIYVDDMFVLNLIINYFILLSTAKLCALPLKRWRFGAAAGFGALYSVLILLPPAAFLANPLAKLTLGAIISLIAFGTKGRIIRRYIAFLAVSAAFGGGVIAVSLLSGRSLQEGLYISVSMRVLVLSFAACYFALTLVFNRLAVRRQKETAAVKLCFLGKTVEFSALYDTGNQLYDPISGLPVMVAELKTLLPLFPEESCQKLSVGAAEFIDSMEAETPMRSKFRLVPYSTVGLGCALLPVFRPDELLVNGKAEPNLLVGISPNQLSECGDFSAVI